MSNKINYKVLFVLLYYKITQFQSTELYLLMLL